MKKFMDREFLLDNKTAQNLYQAAANEPIFDYHCHLIPQQIAANKQFADLTEIWLGGDHYKWRQMRTAGFSEELITGSAAPYDKFLAWTKTIENLIGNPLYHWTHLELQRYFDIYEPLTQKTAPEIWEKANEKLATEELSVRGIFEKFNVFAVGTTDDPADSLEHHRAIADGTAPIGKIITKVIPSFRPDKALNIHLAGFAEYIAKLAQASGLKIEKADDVVTALVKRLDFFVSLGCRASDHALEYPPCKKATDAEIDAAFKKALAGAAVSRDEADAYRTKIMRELGKAYAERNVVMQLHFAAIRNVNGAMFAKLGPDTGFDGAHDRRISENLAGLFNEINATGSFPKTILYTLNAKDYYPLATIMGGYQGFCSGSKEGGAKKQEVMGKMQLGSAWWFYDHRDGMEEQMRVLANLGMLPAFVGMLTDSRSFLSYPRHEYFRRILCSLIGRWVENGEYPADMEQLTAIVRNISFGNAERFFA